VKSRAGYWISGALIVVAVIGAILWVGLSVANMTDKVDAFTRVSAEHSGTVHLEAHKYVIYFEGPDADELNTPSLGVTVTDENGSPVPAPSYLSELTYSFGGHEGTAEATVTPDHEGDYRVSVANFEEGGPDTGVAIGESLSRPLLRTIFGAILIGALFGLTGIALLATTIVRRHNARRPPPGPPPIFVQAPPPAYVPAAQVYRHETQTPSGQETPYGQDQPRDPPPPPYGQTPSPGPPPPPEEPPPPPPLWSPGS
jgi:hypothetical protein